MFKDDHRHQVASAVFQWTLKNQVRNPFVAVFADVMCWCRFDFFQINFGNELRISVMRQKIGEHHHAAEHLLGKSIENVARLDCH